jgi:hypothetical protein
MWHGEVDAKKEAVVLSRAKTLRAPAPDDGWRVRSACAGGDLSQPGGLADTALNGADAFVAKMLKSISDESQNQAERGSSKCNMAIMSSHSLDPHWTSMASSGLSRKDHTIKELQRGLSQLGFADAQVNEIVQKTPRGANRMSHYTVSVGGGTPQRPASAPAAGLRKRPSSAPPGGRPSVESAMPKDLLQMSQKLSDAERALSEVRAGIANHMATSGGAQPSAPRPEEPGVPQARPSSAPGSQQRTVAPGRIRPSSAPGVRTKDAAYERIVNRALNDATRVPLHCPRNHPKLPQPPNIPKPKRSSSCPGHSAARAAARGQAGGRAKRQTKSGNMATAYTDQVGRLLTQMPRSTSWVPASGKQGLAGKPLPSSHLKPDGERWIQSTKSHRKHSKSRKRSKEPQRQTPSDTAEPAAFEKDFSKIRYGRGLGGIL